MTYFKGVSSQFDNGLVLITQYLFIKKVCICMKLKHNFNIC